MTSNDGFFFYQYSKLRRIDLLLGPLLPTLKPKRYDLTGKTAIVTGANVGIGLEISRTLADFGASVVLACRNKEKAESARLDIIENSRGKISPDKVEVRILDCGDLESVRNFTQNWGSKPIDILVNNAGITTSEYRKTKQGFESTYAINMLSQYLLILLLLPSLASNARIINVSSAGNYSVAKQLEVDDLDHSKFVESKHRLKDGDLLDSDLTLELYTRSKLLQIYFTREMQKRLDGSEGYKGKNITVHAYHPGLVKSDIWHREEHIDNATKRFLVRFVNALGVSTTQGAATAIHLATSNNAFANKGMYWDRMSLRAPNRLVEDVEARAKIWEKMAEECQLESRLRL